MKKCSYCGAEYSDDTALCAIDGTPLESSNPALDEAEPEFTTLTVRGQGRSSTDERFSISPGNRILLWLGAWFVVAAATTGFQLMMPFIMPRLAWLFPMGLVFHSPSDEVTQNLICFLGWLLYLGLSIYGLTRRDRRYFYLAYAILIVLLVLNVTGCRVEISQMHFGC